LNSSSRSVGSSLSQAHHLAAPDTDLLIPGPDSQTIQALSNPHYLLELSSTGYLDSEPFLNFVTYLEYWEKPEYAKYLM
jgi:hypothetical protein